jgi:hypothetical protein
MSCENDLNEMLDDALLTNFDIFLEKRKDPSEPFTARQFYGKKGWQHLANCFGATRVGTRFSFLVAQRKIDLIPCGRNSANAKLYQRE